MYEGSTPPFPIPKPGFSPELRKPWQPIILHVPTEPSDNFAIGVMMSETKGHGYVPKKNEYKILIPPTKFADIDMREMAAEISEMVNKARWQIVVIADPEHMILWG